MSLERRIGTVVISDESGMAEEERVLGEVFYDFDSDRAMVQVSQFVARPATDDERREYYRRQPSESGYGWTNDGAYPFFPGMPCVHCGRFVGRDNAIFNLEHFEMSATLASVDAEHRDCSARAAERWREFAAERTGTAASRDDRA